MLATGIGLSTKTVNSKKVLNQGYSYSNGVGDSTGYQYLGFYSPDIINNGQSIKFANGDKVIITSPSLQKSVLLTNSEAAYSTDYFGNEQTLNAAEEINLSNTQDLATAQDGIWFNLNFRIPNPITTVETLVDIQPLADQYDYELTTTDTRTVGNITYTTTIVEIRVTNSPTLGQVTTTTTTTTSIVNSNGVLFKNTGCLALSLQNPVVAHHGLYNVYYKRPLAKPYPNNPITDKFFIVPQDIWYDETTHNKDTVYKIFSGDCFPQKQYYRTAYDDADLSNKQSVLLGFYSYNRTNGAIRSGTPIGYGFPYQSVNNMLTDNTISDDYLYDRAFTPRNQFQSALPYNPNLIYTSNTIATIYYSGKRLNGALYGNNRIWDFNSNGVLENVYGRITDLSILLGTSGNNAIFVKQERNTTLQYFDNTARLVTTSVEAILGTGGILDTKGTFLTVSGSSHKFAKTKCLSPTSNKEFDIWFDVNTRTFNRFGSDGSRIISDSIASFLLKYTTLGNLNEYNNPDRPAHDYGILARWDNQKKEYVCTFRLVAKHREIADDVPNLVGDIVTNGDVFGFENFPVLYKCIKANTGESPSNTEYFTKYNSYIDDLHQCYTLVWNELDNAWKGFYSYLPNIYGNSANNYLSASPVSKNLLYEHNKNNEARYYCSVPQLAPDEDIFMWFYGIGTFTIGGEVFSSLDYIMANDDEYNIAGLFGVSTFPYETTNELNDHTSYYVYDVNVKRFYRIKSFLSDNVWTIDKNEDVYFPNDEYVPLFYYSTCNTGQPLIEGVFNEGYPRYFSFGDIQLNIELPPSRIETIGGLDSIGQKTTQSYMEYTDFKYAQGQARVASGMDTTNGKTNKRGLQGIEGYWMKLKTFFQPNIKNKMQNQQLIAVEQNKKMK